MSRWLTVTGLAIVALLVAAAPAQAGPFPGFLPTPPVPEDLPMGGGDAYGLVNEIRGTLQSLVNDHQNTPTKALKELFDFVKALEKIAKQAPDCIELDVETIPGAEPTVPTFASGEGGGSHWTQVNAGKVIVHIVVNDCIGNISHPQSAPDP